MSNPPSSYQTMQAVVAFQSARARMLNDDTDPIDEEELQALIGNEEGNVRDILSRLLFAAQEALSMHNAADQMIEQLGERRARYERRYERFRSVAFAVMDALGSKKEEFPHCTAVVRNGISRVIITDALAIEDRFMRIRKEPDKSAIRKAIVEDGEIVAGAELSNSLPNLTIRST